MSEKIKKFLNGQLATSILYLILGLCMVLMPVGTVYFFCKIIFGAAMIGTGLYQIYGYLREKPSATVLDLFAGGILLVLGGFLFLNPQIVVKLLPVLLGMFILVDSVWTIKSAFKLKKKSQYLWKILLIGSLVFVAAAVVLMLNLFELRITFMLAGWVLLVNGIADIVFLILIRRGMKKADRVIPEGSGDTKCDDNETYFQSGCEKEAPVAAEPVNVPAAVTEPAVETAPEAAPPVKMEMTPEAAAETSQKAEPIPVPEKTASGDVLSEEKALTVELTLDPKIQEEISSAPSVERPLGETDAEPLEEWKD